ncbi:MAG: OsmC family protein [Gemmatimonadaceae bacterium]
MSRTHDYRGQLTWTGARHGSTSSYDAYSREYTFEIDGKPPLRGSADALFRGDRALHNPEDLFVAALSSCHLLAYLALAARAGLVVVGYRDSAVGTLTFERGGGRFTDVLLRPQVVIAVGQDESLALRLHDDAHGECFIASSVACDVRHEPTVTVAHSTGPAGDRGGR